MKKPLFLIAFLCSFLNLFAQQQWVNFTNGLTINDLIEYDDTLWAATTGGLVKINLENNQRTFYNRGNSKIPSNNVLDIQLDAENQLWVSTDLGTGKLTEGNWELFYNTSGLLRLNTAGQMVVVDQNSISTWNGFSFEKEYIVEVYQQLNDCQINQNNGEIWWTYSTYGEYSIYHYNNDLELLEYNNDNSTLPDFSVSQNPLIIDDQQRVWVGNDCGLFRYSNGEWLNLSDAGYPYGSYNYIGLDDNGDVWSVVNKSTFCSLPIDPSSHYLIQTREDGSFNQYPIPYDISLNGTIRIFKLAKEDTPAIYVGTTKNGLWKYDFSDWTYINTSIPTPIHNSIREIYVDGDETYVLGGTNYLADDYKMTVIGPDSWVNYDTDNPWTDVVEELPKKIIGRHLDTLWAYGNSILLGGVDGEWNKRSFPDLLEDVDEDNSLIYYVSNKEKWILNNSNSFLFYKAPDRDWQIFSSDEHGAVGGGFRRFFTDPNTGFFWLASYSGLSYFDKENWHIIDVSNCGQYPAVNDIEVDENGIIWGVTSRSVFKINKDTAVIIPTDEFVVDLNHPLLTDNPTFRNVEIDNEGAIWVSHKRGIARLNIDEEWMMLNHKNSGVQNGIITHFEIDEMNNFWLGSNEGGLAVYNANGLPDFLSGATSTSVEVTKEIDTSTTITASPNPVSRNQAITFDIHIEGQVEPLIASIYNLQGQLILQDKCKIHQNNFTIKGVPFAGIYFLHIRTNQGVITTKFIVE